MQVGENTANPNGQKVTVAPECTFSTAEAPAADVAAHSAAALALSSIFLGRQGVATEDPLASAVGLYQYSISKAPLTVTGAEGNATDAGVPPVFGVRAQNVLNIPTSCSVLDDVYSRVA